MFKFKIYRLTYLMERTKTECSC